MDSMSPSDGSVSGNASTRAADAGRAGPRRSPRWFPIWYGVIVVIGVGLTAYVRLPAERLPPVLQDTAVANVINIATALLLFLMWSMWLALFSGHSLRVRWLPVGVFAGLVLAAAFTLRVDEVWGGLLPYRVSWRWSAARDYALEPLVSAPRGADGEVRQRLAPSGQDFPEFLGPGRRAAVEDLELDPNWDAAPPRRRWQRPMGSGWSGFVAAGGLAYTLEQRGDDETVSCYDVETGEPMWATAERARHTTVLGGVGPRSTPTIYQSRVYALGATGILRCLDGPTGTLVWRKDLLQEFDIPPELDQLQVAWGRAASPLAFDEMIVVPVGGTSPETRVSLVAYQAATGDKIWQGGHHQISYASPSLATLGGQEQILVVMESCVAGYDIETGQQLWEHPWPGSSNANASASQAWAIDSDRVFVSKGYGQGSSLFSVRVNNDAEPPQWETEEIWANRAAMKTKFTNASIHAGHAFGLDDGVLSCVDLETGERAWKQGRFGHGQLLRVGSWLLVLAEDGELVLVKASPEAYHEAGRVSVLEGKTWNNLCLYGNRLLVRNGEMAACYELSVIPAAN